MHLRPAADRAYARCAAARRGRAAAGSSPRVCACRRSRRIRPARRRRQTGLATAAHAVWPARVSRGSPSLLVDVEARERLASRSASATTLPSLSTAARTVWTEAGPFGSQPWPSSRMPCTRTGLPTAFEQHGGVHGGVAGIVAAVGAGAGRSRSTCTFRAAGRASWRRRRARNAASACRSNGGDAVALIVDDGAGRAHGGVRLERPFVGRLDHLARRRRRPRRPRRRLAPRPARLLHRRPCGCGRRGRPCRGRAA